MLKLLNWYKEDSILIGGNYVQAWCLMISTSSAWTQSYELLPLFPDCLALFGPIRINSEIFWKAMFKTEEEVTASVLSVASLT